MIAPSGFVDVVINVQRVRQEAHALHLARVEEFVVEMTLRRSWRSVLWLLRPILDNQNRRLCLVPLPGNLERRREQTPPSLPLLLRSSQG